MTNKETLSNMEARARSVEPNAFPLLVTETIRGRSVQAQGTPIASGQVRVDWFLDCKRSSKVRVYAWCKEKL